MARQSRRQGTSANGVNAPPPDANQDGGVFNKSAQECVLAYGVWDASAESDSGVCGAGDAGDAGDAGASGAVA
jgi:hypothetical protein